MKHIASAATALLLAFGATAVQGANEVNLYTTREPGLIKPILEAFTAKTGTKVNFIFLKDGLAERVAAEGQRSPADVLMTVDIGNLLDLVDRDVTQPVQSEALNKAIPAPLRDKDGKWYALSLRARIVYRAKGKSAQPVTYESLAEASNKGKICIRSGLHPYNVALTAAYLTHHGRERTEAWLKGMKANLARKPSGGDREVARDILGGLCDLGVGNSYYVGLMRSGTGGAEQKSWGDGVDAVLPKFTDGGTHVNASGAAVAKYAPNKANAIALLEYLASDEAQQLYAKANFEYPVKPGIAPDPIIAALGPLQPDTAALTDIAKNRKQAVELIDAAGFDS
jgi:iron(III) transport system substrate-binding protein